MSALSSRAPQGLPSLDVELKTSDQLLSHDGNGVTPTRKSPHTPMTPGEFRERAGRLLSLKNPHATTGKGLAAAVAYTLSSCSMILVNKLVLTGYHWEAPCSLMLFQNAVVTVVVLGLRAMGAVSVDPINLRMCLIWLPVNAIFVAMLVSSFCALQFLQVAMCTILKNCTNVLTALGEWYLTRVQHDMRVWGSLLLMILSAGCAGYTDLSFHASGYMWQGLNCCLTAAYTLVLRHSMGAVREMTPNNAPLGEFTMVLLNSLLSLPFAGLLAVGFGEWEYVLHSPLLRRIDFWLALTLSGSLGLAISFSSLWCLHMTSPTTHGLIGSLNKIPLAVLGIMIFRAPTTLSNLLSISVGLLGGVLFGQAKVRQKWRESSDKDRRLKVDAVEEQSQ